MQVPLLELGSMGQALRGYCAHGWRRQWPGTLAAVVGDWLPSANPHKSGDQAVRGEPAVTWSRLVRCPVGSAPPALAPFAWLHVYMLRHVAAIEH